MATRHELIHIDFVANAGKANPVLKSLQVSCDDARIAKEKLDEQLAKAKATGAPAEVIAGLEKQLKEQTKTWEALQKGVREYTKGIDTLSKGIKEFNAGTLDEMSAKFNKSVYNAAKLAQSAVKTGSKDWNELQRLMDATDRNVTRAREDIVTMMQSLKDGSAVSTVQLTRARDVLEDLSRLAVTNSEEWRGLKAQMNEVSQAIDMVANTERSLKGEIASEQDALRLSNALTQESIALRHANGEAAMESLRKEREGLEGTMKGISEKIVKKQTELDQIQEEISMQESLDEIIKDRDDRIAAQQTRKQEAEQRKAEAQATITAYEEWQKKVGTLKDEVKDLEKATKDSKKTDDEKAAATEQLTKKQEEYNAELAKTEEMRKGRDKARRQLNSANRTISSADEAIITTKNEFIPERKSEAEMANLRQQAEGLTGEIKEQTQAFNDNAQAITNLNKRETEAAIEMAQSENVSMEKVKQAIDLLKKKIETEATDEETMRTRGEAINRLTERYTQMNAEVAKLSKPIADRLKAEDLGTLSETEIRQGIDAAKQLIKTYETGDEKAKTLAEDIVRAEKHLEKTGLEAVRQAEKQREAIELMETQLSKGSALTESALKAQVQYWRQLADDPKAAAEAVKQYTANMKQAQDLLDVKNRVDIRMKAGRLQNMDRYSVSELQEGIEAAKKMQQTFHLTDDEVKKLSEDIVAAETRINKVSVETERAAQRQRETIELMEKQLSVGSGLTESALKAQVQYWQRLADDPKQAADAVKQYADNLKTAQDLLKEKSDADIESKAERLKNMDNYSVSELKEAIEAAKQMQQTFKLTDDQVKELSENIVKAETRISKVSVETERAAQKQREGIEQMEKQLAGLTTKMSQHESVSLDVLKTQHNYWQRLIDDPKNAGQSLQEYEDNLAEVERLQRRMVGKQGQEALDWFRGGEDSNASANDIKARTDAMKAWRDTLPAKDKADVIAEIDGYLQKTGQSAKKAAEEIMPLADALDMAGKAGTADFAYTPQEIQAATKALEQQRDVVIKTIKAKRDNKEATDAEEKEFDDLTKKLRDLKFEQDNVNMSQEKMRRLMEQPAQAVSLDELRAAIKRADGELRRMEGSLGKNSKEYKAFAEQVKQAKNTLKDMEGAAKASASAWEKAVSRLKTYVGLYMGFNILWQKMTGAASDLMELSDRMGEVRKTTQMTADEVGRLSDNLKKMDVRTPLQELMSISASAGQLGLKSAEDVQGFTEAANKLMIALPEMGREAATEMMRVAIATGEVEKIRKQLQEGTIEGSSATAVAMEKIASTIDRLRASSASTAPEITDFVKRVGAVGAQSGITIDQVAALGSTVSSLGMRVEMSATALSRMLPAIRNNAFEIAKSIGVTPETVRELFDAGRGMEVILMILQRMKDANMDADSIESMMGMGGMRDIMKDLNQQGARAGIVFAGLSQNVDELRRQLGVANLAYEENIAIQQEFNRMNETTAAKWERLKNQIEELFVGDQAQRYLGSLIDGLRGLVDLITGPLKGSILILGTLIGLLKIGLGAGLVTAVVKVIDVFKNWRIAIELTTMKLHAMKAAQWGNLFTAIAGAVLMLVLHFRQLGSVMTGVAKAIATLEAELRKEVKAVNELFHAVAKSNVELENKRKKLEEVKKAGKDATDAENQLKKANAEHAATIREINSKYGQYLGYMLSETSSAQQLAKARELINAKLRETITLKQREAALGNIEQEYGGKVNKKAASTEQEINKLFGDNYDVAARVSVAISEAAEKYAKDARGFRTAVDKIISANSQFFSEDKKNALRNTYRMSNTRFSESDIVSGVASSLRSAAEGYREATEEYMKQEDAVNNRFEARTNNARKNSREKAVGALNAILGDWKKLVDDYQKAEGEEKERLAAEVYKQQRSYANAVANNAEYFENDNRKAVFDKNINNMKTYEKGLRSVAGEAIRTIDAMERAESKVTGIDYTNGGESGNNPWGGKPDAGSTDWKNMTAEQLVNRRKQMKDFVNAIQTDTDVQSVLKEDAALKKAIEKGMSSDMRTVIEWYNTERLKIQDELHARHLTNTGDWMDPKKQKAAHKQFQAELNAYLEELDAYYTERKTEIEQARSNEEITEGEAWRRNLKNENEWYQRRAELMKLYGEKAAEVTEKEQDAIVKIIAERTGDSEKFVRAMIRKTIGFAKQIEASGDKGAAMVHDWYAKLDLQTQKSFLKSQQAITKQVKFIEDTLAKERPYDGITKNLQDNLDKMGVLAARMRRVNDELTAEGKEPKFSNAEITAQSYKEMAFYLKQAGEAYSIDVSTLLRRMAQEGMAETAKEIEQSDMLKQAVMGQLRKTYQEVQDAIKKEASQIKKDVEILWNDETLGPDGRSIKATFDKAIAQLGMQQDSVSRANSLIGAGTASDNVATRLAMKQIEVQMRMQETQFKMFRTQANQRMAALRAEAAEHERIAEKAKKQGDMAEYEREILAKTTALRDADNVKRSLGLTLAEETKKEEEQKAELLKLQEESQNRLYQSLREWADLLTSSIQGVMEASHAGDAEYYNERAKLDLTGKGGPGAGTYVVIDNAGTSDATAHYEYLDERQALERQHDIERENAQAEAMRKMWDDFNMKLSEQITDWINAAAQQAALNENTAKLKENADKLAENIEKEAENTIGLNTNVEALNTNTGAIQGLTAQLAQGIKINTGEGNNPDAYREGGNGQTINGGNMGVDENGVPISLQVPAATEETPGYGASWMQPPTTEGTEEQPWFAPLALPEEGQNPFAKYAEWSSLAKDSILGDQQQIKEGQKQTDKQNTKSTQSAFAKMSAAANLYGVAYQAMANDNLDATQKFQMIALQTIGSMTMAGLDVLKSQMIADAAAQTPGVLGKLWNQLGYWAAPVFAVFTGLLGGLMGLATSKISSSKSQIASVTGASVGAGRLATGMLTYAEGNVNEFTDPASLTPGRQYNVDGADGKTYRARYMGKDAKTHITNGPEFHLVGEKGREAIIDAHTTRLMQTDDTGIWQAIQTLYNGGRVSGFSTRRGRGVRAFAEGNINDFEDISGSGMEGAEGFDDLTAMQDSLDRNTAVQEALLERLNQPIVAQNVWTGPDGIPNMVNKYQKEAKRHGVKYL